MTGSVVDDTIGGSSCLISVLLTFNTMLNLCHSLTFLWICFLRFRLSLHFPGVLWLFVCRMFAVFRRSIVFLVFVSSLLCQVSRSDISRIIFLISTNGSDVSCRKLTVCTSLSFYLLFAIQLCSMIVGSAKLRKWSHIVSHKFHSIYLVYVILSWSFLGTLIIVTMICWCSSLT